MPLGGDVLGPDATAPSKIVGRWLAAHPRVVVLHGARYSPHDNPVERIWGALKAWLANSPTATIQGRVRQVHAFFRARSPTDMLATAAPHSSPWLPAGYMHNFRQAALAGLLTSPPRRSERVRPVEHSRGSPSCPAIRPLPVVACGGRLAGLPSLGAGRKGDGSSACTGPRQQEGDADKEPWMPPSSYAPAHSPASLDLPTLDRVIATLLLRLDLVVVAVTGEQPGPTTSSAAGGPVADERAGYYPAVQQQPNPAAEAGVDARPQAEPGGDDYAPWSLWWGRGRAAQLRRVPRVGREENRGRSAAAVREERCPQELTAL